MIHLDCSRSDEQGAPLAKSTVTAVARWCSGSAVATICPCGPIAADGSAIGAVGAVDTVGAWRTRSAGTASTAVATPGGVMKERIMVEIDDLGRGDEDRAAKTVTSIIAGLPGRRG
jgi:hypothetical protein